MIAVGDRAPNFETMDESGSAIQSSSFRGRPLILFFYPRAGSLGCTREALGFAKVYPDLQERGVQVVGISVDSPDSQRAFSGKCHLPYRLLTDPSREIAGRFGVLGAFGFAKRVTFLIDPDGRVVHVIDSVLPGTHVEQARRYFADVSG